MSLENWAKNSWLERRESDAEEIARENHADQIA
jgi:hypothetical protein